MQIFKRVSKKLKPAQNLIEFVFVFPMLIFITLVIFETALFWQDVNAIYNLNAEINANVANLDYTNLSLGDPNSGTPADVCPAATRALEILKARDSMISMSEQTYLTKILGGSEPFALYEYYTDPSLTFTTTNEKGETQTISAPQIALWVDCRDPFQDGITTQIQFYHKTLIMQATIPSYSSQKGTVIIPKYVFIASPRLNTIGHY